MTNKIKIPAYKRVTTQEDLENLKENRAIARRYDRFLQQLDCPEDKDDESEDEFDSWG